MKLEDLKIKDSDINSLGVVAAPDKLMGTAQENKGVFDRLIREAVSARFNALIDYLTGDWDGTKAVESDSVRYLRSSLAGGIEWSADGETWLPLAYSDSGEGGPSTFYAEYGVTTCDEMEAAYQAGKALYCVVEGYLTLPFAAKLQGDEGQLGFEFRAAAEGEILVLCLDDEWELHSTEYAPGTHAGNHAKDGSDPITPDSIGAVKLAQGADNAGSSLYVNDSGNVGLKAPAPNFFKATFGETTSAEIEAAYQAGMTVVLSDGATMQPMYTRHSAKHHTFLTHTLVTNPRDDLTTLGCFKAICMEDVWSLVEWAHVPACHAETHAADGSDPITPDAIGAVALAQGEDNAGQPLVVGSDGNVAPAKKISAIIVTAGVGASTIRYEYADGTADVTTVTEDENGNPVSVSKNGGTAIPVTWTEEVEE